MDEYSAKQVKISDSFWSARLEVNSSRAIFHQWEQLEKSGCIDNFRIACGELVGFREGWFFADSDAYKWLDAAARIQASWPESALDTLMDDLIRLLKRAQDPDGYIFTYNQIHFPGTRWVNLMIEHELYCHGHLIEAGVSHFQATGRSAMLEIACKAADRVVEDFNGKSPAYTSGHEEIELALLRLYRLTTDKKYLDMARQLLEQRGRMSRASFMISQVRQLRSAATRRSVIRNQRDEYFASHPEDHPTKLPPGNYAKTAPYAYVRWLASDLNGKYLQQHSPIRKQTEPVGHSVRFGYLQTAIAMLLRTGGDQSLLGPLEKAWDSMVTKRMYVTGGIGSVPGLEGFGRDYELDPEYAYAETCAALSSMFWNWEMALITGDARYSELLEWQLYNASAVGMGLDGTGYLYNNPLTCQGGITRKSWYAVPCCPSNLSRTWADLGKYIYSSGKDGIWIHQFISNSAVLFTSVDVKVEIMSGLPWDGNLRIAIDPIKPTEFTVHFRVPEWATVSDNFSTIKINGVMERVDLSPDGQLPGSTGITAQGYDPRKSSFASITRTWSAGDSIELDFDMPVKIRRAHPKVKGHRSKVAVTRGPLVYCLENIDNPGLDIFSTCLDLSSLMPQTEPELLGGITTIRGVSSDGRPLILIPYHLWANRGESQMNVWINSRV